MTGYRLETGGTSIDRAHPLSFRFDDRDMRGFAGDTLASALLAGGLRTVARSFKYHRRRGVFSAGPEEPNALVTLGEGARAQPNSRATMAELHDGLIATSQNRWPSLERDVLAVNGLLAPLLSAGFYYKTFMGPTRGAWQVYERFIRRAAGMGTAPAENDPDSYAHAHLFCDVLVVGAGPTGLAAALAAARSGARVALCDERAEPGGWLFAEAGEIDAMPAGEWARATAAALRAFPDFRLMPRTTVYGYYDGNVLGAVERVTDHMGDPPPHLPRQRHWTIRAREVVLATGAIERPVLFSGNDLPGVMLAGAVRHYALSQGVAAGRRVVLFGGHDGVYETALALAGAGVEVAAIVDPRSAAPADLATASERAGIEVHSGHVVIRAVGRGGVEALEISPMTTDGRIAGKMRRLDADVCATSGGWQPTLHLHSQGGGKPVFDEPRGIFLPGEPRERWRSAGACAGARTVGDCLAAGAEAGRAAAVALGLRPGDDTMPATPDARAAMPPRILWRSPSDGRADKVFVDLQHDVTASDIMLAHREGFRSVEHLKRYTTLGMATDQGKTSSVPGLAMMAQLRGEAIDIVGTTTFRAPYTPVTLGALAGPQTGAHLRPVRHTPMHDWHVANGAEMVAVGAWMRPRIYPREGETLEAAYVREMRRVREGVAIADVSTLGKIEVQGPDAGTFLDRVYANTMSTLAPGKARYGVMLRDDGIVFDDGTCWRLSDARWLITTTTANAGAVMQWLEFLLDVAWPDLKAHLTSVTEQWAGIAVSGPRSRTVLRKLADDMDLSGETLPHMGVRRGRVTDIPVLVARLSFSGELAYELYGPARHGEALWEALLEAGRDEDIAPYGTEALGALRVEKGHVAGGELDGRTTLDDLGLSNLTSRKKAFVGKAMMDRDAFRAADRLQFVGLETGETRAIPVGAQLVVPTGGNSLGHVTANAWSPSLGRYVALALLSGGRARHGQTLTATAPVRGIDVPVLVRDPHFYDPGNERLHD